MNVVADTDPEPKLTVPDAVKFVNEPVDCVVAPIVVPSIAPPLISADDIVPSVKFSNEALLKSIFDVPLPKNAQVPFPLDSVYFMLDIIDPASSISIPLVDGSDALPLLSVSKLSPIDRSVELIVAVLPAKVTSGAK